MTTSNMKDFWTRCGDLVKEEILEDRSGAVAKFTAVWEYTNGEARFDGKNWTFTLDAGVRA